MLKPIHNNDNCVATSVAKSCDEWRIGASHVDATVPDFGAEVFPVCPIFSTEVFFRA